MAVTNRKVIYTAFTGNDDRLLPPAVVDPDIDYIACADAPAESLPPPWQHRPIAVKARNPRVAARWYKVLPHRHLPEYEPSFWLDANYEIAGSFSVLFDELAGSALLATRAHPERDCLYDEAEIVKSERLDHPEIVDIQMAYYRRLGYPARNGLVETNALFRAHRNDRVGAAMEDWWQQIEIFSQRDQLSADFVMWKHELQWAPLPWRERSSAWLRYHTHARGLHHPGEDDSQPVDWLRHAAIMALRQVTAQQAALPQPAEPQAAAPRQTWFLHRARAPRA